MVPPQDVEDPPRLPTQEDVSPSVETLADDVDVDDLPHHQEDVSPSVETLAEDVDVEDLPHHQEAVCGGSSPPPSGGSARLAGSGDGRAHGSERSWSNRKGPWTGTPPPRHHPVTATTTSVTTPPPPRLIPV